LLKNKANITRVAERFNKPIPNDPRRSLRGSHAVRIRDLPAPVKITASPNPNDTVVYIALGKWNRENGLPMHKDLSEDYELEGGDDVVLSGPDEVIYSGKGGAVIVILFLNL
jgi:hypothetical protein